MSKLAPPMLIFVEGRPRTKGSFKVTKTGGVRPDNPDSLEMEERIRRLAAVHWEPLEASKRAFVLTLTAFIPRPKNHYGTGRNANKLKASAPLHPMMKRRDDLDKMLRLVCDALTGIVWEDDAQVVRIKETAKMYTDIKYQPLPGFLIGVTELPG